MLTNVFSNWDRGVVELLLMDKSVDSIYVKMENAYSYGECAAWHNSIRIFRNNGTISYRNKVHNELFGHTKSVYSSVVLHHSGYILNQIRENEKFLRTKTLLEKEIQRKP